MAAAVHFGFVMNMFLGVRARRVSAGLLGLTWYLAHHQDLFQGFLDILVHLTLKYTARVQSTEVMKYLYPFNTFLKCVYFQT